jgi:ABC-2 type transport system ATP-binding protein
MPTSDAPPAPGAAVIALRAVGKRYVKLEEPAMLLTSVLPFVRARRRELWALRGVELSVQAGETVGVLGHNGAGKTTLLRLLAGVSSPTEGELEVRGRIAPLISLGVGFHPEMSGRENVLVNGMLLGLSAAEVAERFDQIVAFAELEEFIDTPVKFYSSGMFMRLGFAVVVHVQPSVLLVDEILAVGDAGFQLKCLERLRELRGRGAAILVVSHSLHTIRQLCDRALLLDHGRLRYDGEVEQAIGLYESLDDATGGQAAGAAAELLGLHLLGSEGEVRRARYDEPLELVARVRFNETVADPQIAFGAITANGRFGGVSASRAGERWRTFRPGEEAELRIAFRARLGPGIYRLPVEVKTREGARVLARSPGPTLSVEGPESSSGLASVVSRVELEIG